MAKIGEQVKKQKAEEKRVGKLGRQVGEKLTRAEVERREEARRKAKEEAERKRKELKKTKEELQVESIPKYKQKYEKIPEWQKKYFDSPKKLESKQQQKVSEVEKEIMKIKQKYEETKQERKRTDDDDDENELDQEIEQLQGEIKGLKEGKNKLEKGKFISVSSIKDYAIRKGRADEKRERAKQERREQKQEFKEEFKEKYGVEYDYFKEGFSPGVKADVLAIGRSKDKGISKSKAMKELEQEGIIEFEQIKIKNKKDKKTAQDKITEFTVGTDEGKFFRPGEGIVTGEAEMGDIPIQGTRAGVQAGITEQPFVREKVIDTFKRTPVTRMKYVNPITGEIRKPTLKEEREYERRRKAKEYEETALGEKRTEFQRNIGEITGKAGKKYEEVKSNPELKKVTKWLTTPGSFVKARKLVEKKEGASIGEEAYRGVAGGVEAIKAGLTQPFETAKEEIIIPAGKKVKKDISPWGGSAISVAGDFIPSTPLDFAGYYATGKAIKYAPKITSGFFSGAGAYGLSQAETTEEYISSGIMAGAGGIYLGKKGFEKLSDIKRTRGVPKIELAESSTKPFYMKSKTSPTGKVKVLKRRYEGFNLFDKRTYKPATTNIARRFTGKPPKYKKGTFVKQQYEKIPLEVKGYYEGKKEILKWEDIGGGQFQQKTVKTSPFPYDKPSKQMEWFKTKGYEEGFLTKPGSYPKEVKGKPFGMSVSPQKWKTKFEPETFEYSGGKFELPGAYMFASGKGASIGFARLDQKSSTGYSLWKGLFGEKITRPNIQTTFFGKIKKGEFAGEVKGTMGGRELKAYIPKKGFQYEEGVGYLTLDKPEVQVVSTFSERFPFAKPGRFKYKGRWVVEEAQTISEGGQGSKVIGGKKIKAEKPKESYIPSSYGEAPTILVPASTEITSFKESAKDYPSNIMYSIKEPSKSSTSFITKPSQVSFSFQPSRTYTPSKISSSFKPSKPSRTYAPSKISPSFKPSKPSRTYAPSRPKKRIPPKRFIGDLRMPKVETKKRKIRTKTKTPKIFRVPSLVAVGQGIYAPSKAKGEFTGLGIRPMIRKKKNKKKKRKSIFKFSGEI